MTLLHHLLSCDVLDRLQTLVRASMPNKLYNTVSIFHKATSSAWSSLQIAFHNDLHSNNVIPMAGQLYFLTNKLVSP